MALNVTFPLSLLESHQICIGIEKQQKCRERSGADSLTEHCMCVIQGGLCSRVTSVLMVDSKIQTLQIHLKI